MTDILTGRALDEAVARMLGWIAFPEAGLFRYDYSPYITGFQSPDALHNIVLPWVQEKGWEIHINCIARVWGVELYDATKHDYPFIGEALADDMITAVLNALVRASEGQS